MTSKQKKYLNLFIKIAIVSLALFFVFKKVNNQKNLREFELLMDSLSSGTLVWLLITIVGMMFLNWGLEVVKWKYLSKRIESISWWTAVQSVFCGLTWAIFTPNRIGEYGGRILFLRQENRPTGAVAMGLGLFAQLVCTSVFGAISIAWFVHTFWTLAPWINAVVWGVAVLYALGFLVLYFNVRWVDWFVGRFRFLRRIKPFFAVLEYFDRKELIQVLLISMARFAIFTTQYVVLMLVILPDLPFFSMLMMVFILFFIQSALPSLDVFDFSVRSYVASHLYAYITTQEIAVMAIVSCVWFVNLILPAIIGSVFVFNVNYIGANGKS